ncbi:WbqC family protein [Flavicella marina]|uniref:WbqC family protein n=1 Tax=Flavicella marina TaxID=1475951 RepID=UPI001264705C|nr:WbqC family protein [Flavicella marina]
MILVHPTYFSPIIQYAIIYGEKEILFEFEDNFQKQTYRNRCYIANANGKQLLNIPIHHNRNEEKSLSRDVKIDYDAGLWYQNHLKSFQAAYRSSPFFEYYEDDIKSIYDKKHTFLIDLNLDIHAFITEALQEESTYSKTSEFLLETSHLDNRQLVNAKKKIELKLPEYPQMFDIKHGFHQNLSILDLLFMEGPASYLYLKKVKNLLS